MPKFAIVTTAALSLMALGACTVNAVPPPPPAPATTIITPPAPTVAPPGSTVVVPNRY